MKKVDVARLLCELGADKDLARPDGAQDRAQKPRRFRGFDPRRLLFFVG